MICRTEQLKEEYCFDFDGILGTGCTQEEVRLLLPASPLRFGFSTAYALREQGVFHTLRREHPKLRKPGH